MIAFASVSVGCAALLAAFGLSALVSHALGDRQDRRRRRNYRRVISRAKRPMVMLNVRTGKA